MDELDQVLRERLPVPGPWLSTRLRLASVVCPIVTRDGEDHVLFVARPAGQRQHPGQIAFPGGMRQGKEDPIACALRECHEEIGAPVTAVNVLGILPPRESSSGILVHCVVGRLAPVPLHPDPREVDRVLHVPLAELRDSGRWEERAPLESATGRQPLTSPHFEFASDAGKEVLWGLTARFVRDLLGRLAPMVLVVLLGAMSFAQELPPLWRLGPLPTNAVEVVVTAKGGVRGERNLTADRPVVIRADARASWSAVHAVLTDAWRIPVDAVLFAARLPDGREGAYTLALPESFEAPAELHVSMHRGRDGVPATSLQLPLERFRRGFPADSPVALGVSAVGDAPFGQVLEALATAADAGFARVVPWCVAGSEPAKESKDGRLAIDCATLPAFAVPAIEARLQPSGIFAAAYGNAHVASNSPRKGAKSWHALVSPPPKPPNKNPVFVRVDNTWLGKQQLACGAWPDATSRPALFETALSILYCAAMSRPGTDSVGFDPEADRDFITMHGRGIGWLVARQRHDGCFVDENDVRAAAIAAYALAEAEPIHGPGLRGFTADALSWLAKVRRSDGGWSRAADETSSDAITTAWCALAFEAGEYHHLGATLRPNEISRWFASVRNDDGSYRLRPADARLRHDGASAAALLARCVPADAPLRSLLPDALPLAREVGFSDPTTTFFMSYATLAIGPEPFRAWTPGAVVVLQTMRKDRVLQNSWAPLAELSAVATTSLHGLVLCNYFRYRTLVR